MNEQIIDAIRDLLYGSGDITKRIDTVEQGIREYNGLIGKGPKNTLKEALNQMHDKGYDKGWNGGWSTGYDTASSRPNMGCTYTDY